MVDTIKIMEVTYCVFGIFMAIVLAGKYKTNVNWELHLSLVLVIFGLLCMYDTKVFYVGFFVFDMVLF